MRAVWMVSGLKGTTYEERLKELDMTTLEDRRVSGDLIEVYKILTGKERVDPSVWFSMASDRNQGMATRNSSGFLNLQKPPANLQIRSNFFSVRVIDPWNCLPDSVKQAETVNTFKNRYDKFMST